MRSILTYPDERLGSKSQEVTSFAEVESLGREMEAVMKASRGVGLAAIQIGEPLRVLVMDCPEGQPREGSIIIVNPQILVGEGLSDLTEGCLSLPGIGAELPRFEKVSAKWQDEHGSPMEGEFVGLAAVCLQHEMDHFDGRLFVDALSPLKKSRLLDKFKKMQKAKAKQRK